MCMGVAAWDWCWMRGATMRPSPSCTRVLLASKVSASPHAHACWPAPTHTHMLASPHAHAYAGQPPRTRVLAKACPPDSRNQQSWQLCVHQ